MAYAAKADLERAAGGAEELIKLTDHDGDGAVDSVVLDASIEDAESKVDSYLGKRYATLETTPPAVRRVTAEIAVYQLMFDRGVMTSAMQTRHDQAMEYLRDCASGLVKPGGDPPPARATTVNPRVGTRADVTGANTRDALKGLW